MLNEHKLVGSVQAGLIIVCFFTLKINYLLKYENGHE